MGNEGNTHFKRANAMGIIIAGKRLATFTFFPNSMFTPKAKIKTEPTQDIWAISSCVKKGLINFARSVIPP